ncbi:D-2-hydroxyacid dehydrogenase [Ilumatobacter nonamiensis]|uniref:D-2-hydroxyacid dehydrogenase n=1 Tax=Ilumatobacter nonamiensis TaxID=467093 RepID=UPI00068743A7|nr:D-2-hydroxyacid dehydrogenase [Ilumatobacter nonamiensis]
MSDVLFCTDDFAARHGDRMREISPGLEFVTLDGDAPVSDDDMARITLAFFSHDSWPERAASFFGVALRAENLRWLHTMSAGVDSPIFATFTDRGVRLTTSSGSSAPPIARTAMMYLLALSRDLPRMIRAQDRAEWDWHRWDEIGGRSIAIVGWGPIGQEVARLADAFGMHPTIVRRASHGDEPFPVRPLVDLVDIARDHDAMVVALPLTPETEGIVSAEVLDAIGPDGSFVNVGRGELVDQPALTAALVAGRLGGAGIDVTTPEPLPADDPLWAAPNVIITPHNSGSTGQTGQRSDQAFLANLERWVAGDALANEVTS